MSLNLVDGLEIAAEVAPESEALIFEESRMTFLQLAKAARRVAFALRQRGIGPGDKVALALANTPHFPIILYGILYTGATAVPMSVLLQWREMQDQLQQTEAKAFFVFKPFFDQACRAFNGAPQCTNLIVVEESLVPENPAAGDSFIAMMAGSQAKFEPCRTRPDDTAEIIFTSAYDGNALGTELTHYNLFQNALLCQAFVQQYSPEDVCLCVLPLFHSFGQTGMLNAPLLGRSKMVLMTHFETHKVFDVIARERVTLLGMVPSMVHFMVSYKREQTFDLSSIRAINVGGAALAPELYDAFLDRFGIPLLQGYGLTETSPVVAYNVDAATNRPGSVGKPIPYCKVRICRDTGDVAPPGEIGEIVICGHNVMKGYHNKPDQTAAVLRDGWLHTGDKGYLDKDGYLYITGLLKDLIIRAGMNIYPREIENTLLLHPDIREVAVIGIPEPVRGEEVCAVMTSASPIPPDDKALRAFCFDHMAAFKCPRRFEYVDTLPRTADGRVDKSILRQHYSRPSS